MNGDTPASQLRGGPSGTLGGMARATAEAALGAIKWFGEATNAEKLGHERGALDRDFRRYATNAGKLAAAVDRPMCVGVFGPSQAGKSYLVSVLARPGDRPLVADFAGESIDFISEINPAGEKESTGLVTRFTIKPGPPSPPGFPVTLRLLSQADIVKILGNTFFFDGDLKKQPVPSAVEIAEILGAARQAAQPGAVDQLTDEDVWDIQEYFEKQFEGTQHLAALAGYWEEASRLAPRLRLDDRARLFAPLWGKHAPFTDLYLQLVEALQRLGFAADAFCPLNALIPKANSIIDVATLAGLGRSGGDTIPVQGRSGAPVELPRPVVTALVAELRITMREKSWPFFEHTDLLDFPGARSRQKLHLAEFFESTPEALKETFLRGKVAYLFDRYVAEQELTSMLLCVRPSNQDVATLPDMIENWIEVTHGKESKERVGKPILLFFVLTWFDQHLVDKPGDETGPSPARFRSRLEASFLGFFGKAHRWPHEWTPGSPFDNCYWLRNPNYPAEAVIRYEQRREVEILPSKVARIEELKTGFLSASDVTRHFRAPQRAWDAALGLNDGGISYLAENLAPVCNPALKAGQIAARLETLRHGMRERLRRFYVSEDLEIRLKERREAASRAIDEIYACADHGRFGALVRTLQTSVGAVTDVLYQAQLSGPEEKDQADPVASAPASAPARPRPGERPRPGAPPPPAQPAAMAPQPAAATAPAARAGARERQLAGAALRHWMKSLHQAAESGRIGRMLMMSEDGLGEIVAELTAASRRTGLVDRIATDIRRLSYIERDEPIAKVAVLASHHINRFVAYLGFAEIPEAERPQVEAESGARPVFAARPIAYDAYGIGQVAEPYADNYLVDWAFAFYSLVEANATSEKGQTVDVASNARLGQLLAVLEQPV